MENGHYADLTLSKRIKNSIHYNIVVVRYRGSNARLVMSIDELINEINTLIYKHNFG